MPAPLCILAVDQRGWLTDALYGAGTVPDAGQLATVAAIKALVAEGAARAAERGAPGQPGVLVDELYGAGAARLVLQRGLALAMPVERANQTVLVPEYADWPAHLDRFEPVLAKVLIWHNVDGDRELLDAQLQALAGLAAALTGRGRELMLEILVTPSPEQLAQVGGDRDRFDRELLPDLTMAAVDEVHAAGARVHYWKLEGMPEVATFTALRERCEKAGPTTCLVLGRNAPQPQVDRWLTDAASAGYGGFAIGRSVWWNAVRAWTDGGLDRDAAAQQIADGYRHVCDVFTSAGAR
ncbi:MAG: 2-deoxy-5-keto-D-gluconate 6-phosphate aldolase domain-containing protein [Mycobacteriales bacterium]